MSEAGGKKDYGKLIKVMQAVTGVILLALMVLCLILKKKYDISLKNVDGLSEMIGSNLVRAALIIIGVSVLKSFALVFPPAVVFAVCGYIMPHWGVALVINEIGMILSLFIPYFLGRFTGADMVDSLAKRFKPVNKINDYAGANERTLAFIIKFSGVIPGDLSSLLFGAMKLSLGNYAVGAALGMTPLVVVYTFFGVALHHAKEMPWLMAIPVATVVLFTLIGSFVAKKTASKKPAENDTSVGE